MPRCAAPKSTGVKAHARSKPRSGRKASGSSSTLPYVVERNGTVTSRHRTLTAAINERKRRDLQSFRAGQGRPYTTRKVS